VTGPEIGPKEGAYTGSPLYRRQGAAEPSKFMRTEDRQERVASGGCLSQAVRITPPGDIVPPDCGLCLSCAMREVLRLRALLGRIAAIAR